MRTGTIQIMLLLVTTLNIGCSPRTSYKVLSVFFDGVPDSLSTSEQNAPKKIDTKDSLMLAAIANLETGPKYYYHVPYLKQECDKCHDKVVRSSLLQPQPGLCYTCHADFKLKFAYQHGPVASGNCSSCHAPHMSENTGLLRLTGQALCYYCHSKEQVLTGNAHTGIGDTECTKCHDPHGGTNRYVLKQ